MPVEAARRPSDDQLEFARAQTDDALNHPEVAARVHAYYDPSRAYAGSTFLDVEPSDPWRITAADLFAVSTLDVKVGPLAARRLLEYGTTRSEVHRALEQIPVEADLLVADVDMFVAAERFYLAVKEALGSNPWVTASKLCARKRPELLPVRDNVVTYKRLQLGRDYLVDWQTYQHLIQDNDVTKRLHQVRMEAREHNGERIDIPDPSLRLLDVVLWVTAPHRASVKQSDTEEATQ